MATKIGHFEILSELAKSATGTVYKANDPQSGQTVALKAIRLSAFGESAPALEAALLAEAESTKSVSSPNIVPVFGAGEIEGQFCAAMEYVQGNSISTMLVRQEGFSIWDLLDIGRQVCAGLDHAASHQVFHYSLEPAKIMCGWDGCVKILGFGVSSVGRFAPQTSEPPSFLYYMSPEQLRGEELDARSNLFSLGAMFYEMVTERKAFDGPDVDSVCQAIVEQTATPPSQLNPKIHPLLDGLIMKALHKDPAQRYQRGRELLDDLEKCKDSKSRPAEKPAQPTLSAIPGAAKAAAQPIAAAPPRPVHPAATSVAPSAGKAAAAKMAENATSSIAFRTPNVAAPAQAAVTETVRTNLPVPARKPVVAASETSPAYAAVASEDDVETFSAPAPKIAVDPMMAEGAGRGSGKSFSEISELPPLKEIYVEPVTPPPVISAQEEMAPGATLYEDNPDPEEKPKIQPREVAQKAINEIKNLPPRLILYSVAGALGLILAIGIAIALYVHSQNSEDDSRARPTTTSETPAGAAPVSNPTQSETPAASTAAQNQTAPASTNIEHAEPPAAKGRGARTRTRNTKNAMPAAAPAIIPGQLVLDSTPQGAQAQIDGRTDPSYVTPFLLPGLAPGPHTITLNKPGYSSDTRGVEITSGSKTSLMIHLAQMMATLAVTSTPPGANVFIDGKDSGKTTPAQISVDKGQHVVLVRKMGYFDETTTPQFVLGQTVSYSPAMRLMGNADSIRTVGKIKKLFGGSAVTGGQITVSVKTQPKGAQVTINHHMLEKDTPVEVALDPGNYEVDITLSGYTPIHKVITADKGSKLVVDEILQRQ